MEFPRIHLSKAFLAMVLALSPVGCLETGKNRADLQLEVDDQRRVLERRRDELLVAEAKLAKLTKRQDRLSKTKELEKMVESLGNEVLTLKEEVSRLADEKDIAELALKRSLSLRREKVRAEWVGRSVDLSETLGDDYRTARILKVEPTGLRVQRSSGVETIDLKNLPGSLIASLLMSEEEASDYRGRLEEFAKARALQYRRWKETQKERKGQSKVEEARLRLARIQTEIESIEARLDIRMRRISELKSKASAWELKSARAIEGAEKKRAIRHALVFRDEADEIAEGNSRALQVLSDLEKELKELQKPVVADESSGS